VADSDPGRSGIGGRLLGLSGKSPQPGLRVVYAASTRLSSATNEFGRLLSWPADQPRHATCTSSCPVESSSPPLVVVGTRKKRFRVAGAHRIDEGPPAKEFYHPQGETSIVGRPRPTADASRRRPERRRREAGHPHGQLSFRRTGQAREASPAAKLILQRRVPIWHRG